MRILPLTGDDELLIGIDVKKQRRVAGLAVPRALGFASRSEAILAMRGLLWKEGGTSVGLCGCGLYGFP